MEMKMKMEEITKNYTTLHVETFNSNTKRSGVLIKRNIQSFNNGGHVHWKGAAEIILAMCSSYYDINGAKKDLNEDEKVNFERTIEGMAASSLRCIAFAHTEIAELEVENEPDRRQLKEEGLTFIGLVGIKDPCRRGVREAVEGCQYAGVNVKMITGDNIFTAKAIATECGILRPNMGEPIITKGPLGIVSWTELSFYAMFMTLLLWSFTTYLRGMFSNISGYGAAPL